MTKKTAPGVVRVERPEDAPKVFQDAFNAGDLDGLVNLFEPEAVLFPRTRPGGYRSDRDSRTDWSFPRVSRAVGNRANQP